MASNGLSGPTDFLLPGTDTPVSGGTPGGTIDAGSGGFSALLDKFTQNPAMLIGALPLAMSLFGSGNAPYPAEQQLNKMGTNLNSQGQSLAGYLQSGTLPPGAQANVDAGKAAAQARIRSAAARTGTAGSTMEAQQLAETDQQAAGQQFLLADQLLGQGMNAEQLAAGDFRSVLSAQMQRDQQLQNAILNAGRALGGGTGGASTNNYYGWSQPTTAVA